MTSHSPDLLDDPNLDAEPFLSGVSEGGETRIGPIDGASREAMRSRLFSPGELLRLNQLAPDRAVFDAQQARQSELFGEPVQGMSLRSSQVTGKLRRFRCCYAESPPASVVFALAVS